MTHEAANAPKPQPFDLDALDQLSPEAAPAALEEEYQRIMALQDYGTVYDTLKAQAGNEPITAEDVMLALDQRAYDTTERLAQNNAMPDDLDFLLQYLGLSDDIPLSKLGEIFERRGDYIFVLTSTAHFHKTLADRRTELAGDDAAMQEQFQADTLQDAVDRFYLPRDLTT